MEEIRRKKSNIVKSEEEIAGLLSKDKDIDMNDDQKDESENLDHNEHNNDPDVLNKYDLGSKWKNMETVFGSSMIHWFIPLDWNDDELYKRMMNASHSFDSLPSFPSNKHKATVSNSLRIQPLTKI